ncbi:MAG TPA: alpha/beta fold hydrolase [Candidatus Binataceae bacterium]|nr:alpha/beta fold hydrolase [Candidatus Binataceae bacterium]
MRLRGITLVIAILFLFTAIRLMRLNNGGPAHRTVELPGVEPATLYMPENPDSSGVIAPPAVQRPAAVVLVHGFMSDRQMMGALARRIAENGYAVLTIDVHGHGENRNPADRRVMDSLARWVAASGYAAISVGSRNGTPGNPFVSSIDRGVIRADVKQAVDFLRRDPLVDGSRIGVIGHSMGAGAVLDYAEHDPAIKGAVMISGGWSLWPNRPPNALFIFGEFDPAAAVRETSTALAANLAGAAPIELAKVYGDFSKGDAVEAVQIPNVDHVQMIYSPEAAATIVRWLDSIFGTARQGAIDTADPRLGSLGIVLLLFLILLIPLGRVSGSIAPKWPISAAGWRTGVGFVFVAIAGFAAMPIAARIPAEWFLPIVVADVQVLWLAIAGLFMAAGLIHSQQLDRRQLSAGLGMTAICAALAFGVIYASDAEVSVISQRLWLTPERFAAVLIAALLMLPFWFGFEILVRRGGPLISAVQAVIGRVLIIAMIICGVKLQVMPLVVVLIMPAIAIISVPVEIFAASAYSTSRNLMLIALVETMWFAWTMVATTPITFMF